MTSGKGWSAAPWTHTVLAGDGTGLPLTVIGDELLVVADGVLEELVGCGVEGVEVGLVPGLDGAELGLEPGLELDVDDEVGPPKLRPRIGVALDVGLELGVDGGVVASWFAVLLLAAGGGLNTWFTVVPSQPSGSHKVAEELGLGVVLGLLGLAGVLELGGVEGLDVDVPVGAGAVGVAAPEGVVGACAGGLAAAPEVGADVGTEVGSGALGLVAPALDAGDELGLELGALLLPLFGPAAGFGVSCVPAGHAADGACAALATVGSTATPDAASTTAGSPNAVSLRARLALADSASHRASAASTGVGVTPPGGFTPRRPARTGVLGS